MVHIRPETGAGLYGALEWNETVRTTIHDIQAMKTRGERIPVLTAYDFPSAVIAERAGLPVSDKQQKYFL